jgi:hypothetical protein
MLMNYVCTFWHEFFSSPKKTFKKVSKSSPTFRSANNLFRYCAAAVRAAQERSAGRLVRQRALRIGELPGYVRQARQDGGTWALRPMRLPAEL